MTASAALVDASRFHVAVPGAAGSPLLASLACWSDGEALWALADADAEIAVALARRTECRVWLPPVADGDAGTAAAGRARLYGRHDPAMLVVHAPVLAAVLTALGARFAPELLESLQDWRRLPWHRLAVERVIVRVALGDAEAVIPPPVGPGIAPSLPPVVPADVRRRLAGRRDVVVAAGGEDDLAVVPAVWSAGLALTLPAPVTLAPGEPAAVGVDGAGAGIVLHGTVAEGGGRLRPERVTWWRGGETVTLDMPPSPAGAIVLPE